MRQFDICPLKQPRGRAVHVVVLQHQELSDLRTVLVAPLRIDSAIELRPRLRPQIRMADGLYSLAVDLTAVIDRSELGVPVASAEASADDIKRAIDLAFFGI